MSEAWTDYDETSEVSDAEAPEKKRSAAAQIVDLVRKAAELYHDPDGEPYADIREDDKRMTFHLRSRGLKLAATRMFYRATGSAPRSQAISEALDTLEAVARFEGAERRVDVRVAGQGDTIYLDLANDQWEAVEVKPGSWRVVREPPVRFRRSQGMLALPIPEPGGKVEGLRRFLNIDQPKADGADDAWMLLLAWLTHALTPRGPYCVLALHGEQGSGKSTTARALRRLIDPHQVDLRSEPREERDLMVACGGSWIVAFDNLSNLSRDWSDALCRLSTGAGFGTRELYADREETLFSARRPVLLTGIEELAEAGDLLDRSLIVTLPGIERGERQSEQAFWEEYEAAWPKLLGAVLDAVAATLVTVKTVSSSDLERMADFDLWGRALEVAMDWPTGSFLAAYRTNRGDAVGLTLDAQPVAQALQMFAREKSAWTGTARQLHAELESRATDRDKKAQAWPKDPGALGRRLRRLAPALRAQDVDVTFSRDGGRGRSIMLRVNPPEKASQATQATQEPLSQPRDRDGSVACDGNDGNLQASRMAPGLTRGGFSWNGREPGDEIQEDGM